MLVFASAVVSRFLPSCDDWIMYSITGNKNTRHTHTCFYIVLCAPVMTAILYLSQLQINVKIVIIKYLFSHSLRCNMECVYICKFLYCNVGTRASIWSGPDGNLELCDSATAWRTCWGTFHHAASCTSGICKRRSWCAWLCSSKYYLCLRKNSDDSSDNE
jgi:hypothetical protein